MKKALLKLAAVAFIIGSMSSCTTTDSAEVALVVDQMGNDKGIPNVTPASGLYFISLQRKMFSLIQHQFSIKSGQK